MRGLEFQDVFSMARIISKIDIAKEMDALAKQIKCAGEVDVERVGIQFILTLIGKASTKEVEKEIYVFLSDVLSVKIEDLRHMKPKQFLELIKDADVTEWKDFFIQAVQFVQSARK